MESHCLNVLLLPTFVNKLNLIILRTLIIGLTCLVLWGCGQEKAKDTNALNGYWEIGKVSFPSGETKIYTINAVVDYFLLTGDSTGIRQKVMPQLDGTFISNGEQETFTIESRENELYINYDNQDVKHSEKVLELNQEEFVVINKDELTYHYKPFEKFELK